MLKQLFTAAALIATTATAGLAQPGWAHGMQQLGVDSYVAHTGECAINVSVKEKDSVGDVYVKTSILCGEFDYDTRTFERETRMNLWVRCEATGNDWMARRNRDGSSDAWEAVKSRHTQQVADAACGRIGAAALRTIN